MTISEALGASALLLCFVTILLACLTAVCWHRALVVLTSACAGAAVLLALAGIWTGVSW